MRKNKLISEKLGSKIPSSKNLKNLKILSSTNKKFNKISKRSAFKINRVQGLLLGLSILSCGVFFAGISVKAQLDLYDNGSSDVAGINALMSAVVSDDANGVRFFSKAGKTLVNQKNLGGATAIHLACRKQNLEIVKILIDSGADLNIADNEGYTPLMRAALAADDKISDLLLTRGAKANQLNSAGESAIIHAALSSCSQCLDVMFTKFNFVKEMDIKLLQEQLSSAFVIAKDHEDQKSQTALEVYLDQVIKMKPLLGSTIAPNGTVYKIISAEDIEPQSPQAPIISKSIDERNLIQHPQIEKPKAKFVFIAGPRGEAGEVAEAPIATISVKKNKSAEKLISAPRNYKFSGQRGGLPSVGEAPAPKLIAPIPAKKVFKLNKVTEEVKPVEVVNDVDVTVENVDVEKTSDSAPKYKFKAAN